MPLWSPRLQHACIEEICSTALKAGAYGSKISGAGMGGSVIALVKDKKLGQKVIDACLLVGAKKGWVSDIGDGTEVLPLTRHLNAI